MSAELFTNEKYMDHEVRIRIQEQNAIELKNAIQNLDNKLDSRFMLLVGLIITSIILPVVLHALKLV